MERIFKIKTRSDQNPHELYPSERRYSASIVLGLSVVFCMLTLFSVFMGTLILHKINLLEQCETNCTLEVANKNGSMELEQNSTDVEDKYDNSRLMNKVERDMILTGDNDHYFINIPALVSAVCFVMGLGTLMSFITGILAWKKWYVDHNITFFLLSSVFSTLTSAICLMVTLISLITAYDTRPAGTNKSPLTFSIELNIAIAAVIMCIWSGLSVNIAYKGMKNSYPDDMIVSKNGGRVEVKTVIKGNKKSAILPQDLVRNIPKSGKWAKYFPRKENNSLPNAESNYEYQQRVNNFISNSTVVNK